MDNKLLATMHSLCLNLHDTWHLRAWQRNSEQMIKEWYRHEGKSIRRDWKREREYSRFWHCKYPYWIYFFDTGEDFLQYVPGSIYYRKIEPWLNGYRHVTTNLIVDFVRNKNYFEVLARQFANFPECVLRVIDGVICDDHLDPLPYERVKSVLENCEFDRLFLKPAFGFGGGVDVVRFEKTSNGYMCESGEALYDVLTAKSPTVDWVLQEEVEQAEETRKLGEDCVNTLRLITLNTSDSCSVISGFIKIGYGSYVDNFRAGGFVIGVDIASSQLRGPALRKRSSKRKEGLIMQAAEQHPVTGMVFDGYKLPSLPGAIATVVKVARKFPTVRLIGWDVAIAKSGPVIIEANTMMQDIHIIQKVNGPLFEMAFLERLKREEVI